MDVYLADIPTMMKRLKLLISTVKLCSALEVC